MDVGTFPLQLGFEGEIEKQPMETEAGGSNPSRGKKRPPSPPGDDEELSESAPSDDYDKWSVSDNESQGADCLCTLDDFPKAGCDFDEQNHILFMYPNIELLGPSPIRLYPSFKSGSHVFGSDYNLHDKSDIKITSVRDCSTKCLCAPMSLLQFIDINIAGYHHARPGPARIFGFVAARDTIEPLRNYVYKREISNYEAVSVKQNTGMARLSLTSPVRVISMVAARALMEFESMYELKTDLMMSPKVIASLRDARSSPACMRHNHTLNTGACMATTVHWMSSSRC
ncbi:unnamed protein product [Urochloa decumbens]|uniref:DUF6598 domain-containing protein n=1 Tax=Urochloa decumbens TaxID=240449 RepID=A0ABC9GVL8_9POAL